MTSATTNASGVPIADAPEVRDALIKLDIWLKGQCLKHDLPGLSVGVVHDQELIWSKGYGYADVANKIPATDQTLFRVGSITKTFTATAVMQLVEQGRLSLEDPVSQHLPWFTPQDADPTQPVRVWHLLTHTAGLQQNPPGTDWDKLECPDVTTVSSATRATPLSIPTQTRPKYSNYGFSVVGELVAQLSGVPYTRYVQEKVLQPLGMTNSFFLDGTETRPGLAVPYGRRLSGQARGIEQ
jgi:CubicO group peptidase (beta-lactamase class C family)